MYRTATLEYRYRWQTLRKGMRIRIHWHWIWLSLTCQYTISLGYTVSGRSKPTTPYLKCCQIFFKHMMPIQLPEQSGREGSKDSSGRADISCIIQSLNREVQDRCGCSRSSRRHQSCDGMLTGKPRQSPMVSARY